MKMAIGIIFNHLTIFNLFILSGVNLNMALRDE